MKKRTLYAKDFKGLRIEKLLRETNLLGIVSKSPPFVYQIFLEFYVNLSKDMWNPTSLNFQKMTIRGHRFEFSPNIINQYWECEDVPDNEIEVPETDLMVFIIIGSKVRTWPFK